MVELPVLGSICLDTIQTPSGKMKDVLGGSAVYAAMAASMFTEPGILGMVGSDFPDGHMRILESMEIDTEGIEVRKDAETFRWEADYCADPSCPKAIERKNACMNEAPIIPDSYQDSGFLLLANQEPRAQMDIIRKQWNIPEFIMADTMNVYINGNRKGLDEVVKNVDCVIMNQGECKLYWDHSNMVKAAKGFLEMGPRVVIIKCGEHGAKLFTKHECFAAPALPLEEVTDPTGAGDSMAGGFMGWLARTEDTSPGNLKMALLMGSAVASYTIDGWGTSKLQTVDIDDVYARFRSLREMMMF